MEDRDPNEGSIDPMEPEYWQLGESVQDHIIAAGFESETVEGIAVDIHDVLQVADRIRQTIGPELANATDVQALLGALDALRGEFAHLAWHSNNAQTFLTKAIERIQPD